MPGDILQDEHGFISGGNPTTYLFLSADTDPISGRREWRMAAFYESNYFRLGWMGAPVKVMWDGDVAKLKHVGSLTQRHTHLPRLKRRFKRWWGNVRCQCRYLYRKHVLGKEWYE